MKAGGAPETLPDVTESDQHSNSSATRAARVDIAIMRWRARRVRALGYRPSVIGYTGYGSTSWVRLLARVLLTRDRPARPGVEPTGCPGLAQLHQRAGRERHRSTW